MNSKEIKILLCNIVLRNEYDPFPPVACTSLCNILRKSGYNPVFYDIDARRPSFDQLSEYFKNKQYDIVGISAVTSTGYDYTKKLSKIIKKVSPKTQIILGGNLASGCGIILNKCPIDICVIGEGEKVLLNLVKHWEKYGVFKSDNEELYKIRGLAFLDDDGKCIVTPKESQLAADEIEQPDYDMIAEFSDVNKYLLDPLDKHDFLIDPRSFEPHRKGKKIAQIVTSKGCVNTCTFCHRWIKGYRVIPVDKVINYIKYLKDKYNVGFLVIQAECFGENIHWVEDFIRLIKPLDVLFIVGGARVSIVKKDKTIIRRLKEVGMTALYYGIESGSDKILKIMEKNATVDENVEAMKVCAEAGVFTTIQLVIGMPGENKQTINETIDFVIKNTRDLPYLLSLSVNYLQSLPGTPTYEYLRYHRFFGNSIEEEENYLLKVSDKNASDFYQYVNVSEEPLSVVKVWGIKIVILSRIGWLKNHNWQLKTDMDLKSFKSIRSYLKSKSITYKLIDYMGDSFWNMLVLKYKFSIYGFWKALLIILKISKENDRARFKIKALSLREILKLDKVDNISHTKNITYMATGELIEK